MRKEWHLRDVSFFNCGWEEGDLSAALANDEPRDREYWNVFPKSFSWLEKLMIASPKPTKIFAHASYSSCPAQVLQRKGSFRLPWNGTRSANSSHKSNNPPKSIHQFGWHTFTHCSLKKAISNEAPCFLSVSSSYQSCSLVLFSQFSFSCASSNLKAAKKRKF